MPCENYSNKKNIKYKLKFIYYLYFFGFNN